MRFILLLYTFACWLYPLFMLFGISASGHGFGAVDKTLLLMTFAAICIVPLNYFFLYRVFIDPPFTQRQRKTAFAFLLATFVVMAYFTFDAIKVKESFWVKYLPPIGLVVTMFIAIKLWSKSDDASG